MVGADIDVEPLGLRAPEEPFKYDIFPFLRIANSMIPAIAMNDRSGDQLDGRWEPGN